MYHPNRKCGVLIDFDLTVFAWLTRVPGTDRTSTIPFMALELLQDQYWKGDITRCYHHELEAFVWMLPFVFLAYDNGQFDRKAPFVVDWMTSDPNTCRQEKIDFAVVQLNLALMMVKAAFKDYAFLMFTTCSMVRDLFIQHKAQEHLAYKSKPARQAGLPSNGSVSPPAPCVECCVVIWEEFLAVLWESSIDTPRLRRHRPAFDPARSHDLFQEMRAIYNSFRPLT